LGDGHYALIAGDGLAWIAGELGDPKARRRGHEEVLREARAQGDWAIVASELDQLAAFALEEGRFDEALSMLGEGLRIKRDLELPNFVLESLSRLASALAVAEGSETAARLLGSAEALRVEVGGRRAGGLRRN